MSPDANLTGLLVEWGEGQEEALDELMTAVYAELRKIAANYMRRERAGHTLQATALVNEAYLRLIHQDRVSWRNRAQFFGIAAQLMRRILVDHARAKRSGKRGGDAPRLALDEALDASRQRPPDLLRLDDALSALEAASPRQAKIVELRYFGGLTIEETAHVLDLAPVTVKREWRAARAWLFREMS